MAHISVSQTFSLTLTVTELRLVLKSLRGTIRNDEEKNEAILLGNSLSELRAKHTKSTLLSNEKLLSNQEVVPTGFEPVNFPVSGGYLSQAKLKDQKDE